MGIVCDINSATGRRALIVCFCGRQFEAYTFQEVGRLLDQHLAEIEPIPTKRRLCTYNAAGPFSPPIHQPRPAPDFRSVIIEQCAEIAESFTDHRGLSRCHEIAQAIRKTKYR